MSDQTQSESPLEDANQYPGQPAVSQTETNQIPQMKPKRRRRWWLWLLLVCVLLGVGGVGGFFGYKAFIQSKETRLIEEGNVALQQSNWQAAETAFEQAIQLTPIEWRQHTLEAIRGRAEACFELGNYQQTQSDIEILLVSGENDADLHVHLGKILSDQGNAQAAMQEYAAALEMEPNQVDLRMARAEYFYASGDMEAAQQEAALAGEMDDQFSLPYALKAYREYLNRDYDKAWKDANAALERPDALPLAYRLRGSLYVWQYELDSARTDLDKALELDPSDVEARAMRIALNGLQQAGDAMQQDVDTLLQTAPMDPASIWAQGLYQLYLQKPDIAYQLFSQAIDKDPNRPEFYVSRSQSYWLTKQEDQQTADIEKAFELAPDFIPAISSQAWIHFSRYERENTVAEAEQILQLAPKWSSGLQLLGMYYANVDFDYPKALEYCQQAIDLESQVAGGYLCRGWVYAVQHQAEPAIADFQKALELYPYELDALVGLAEVYAQQEQVDQAIQTLDKALEMAPYRVGIMVQKAATYFRSPEANHQVFVTSILDQALVIDPDHPAGLLLRAAVRVRHGDRLQALTDANTVIDRYPKASPALLTKAMILMADGNNNSARNVVTEVLNQEKNNPYALAMVVQINFKKEDWYNVTFYADKTLALAPWDMDTLKAKGQALLNREKYKEAATAFSQVIEEKPSMVDVYFLRAMAYKGMRDFEAAVKDLEVFLDNQQKVQDLELIDSAESELAYLSRIPPLVNGKRTYVDTQIGFALTFADSWTLSPDIETENLIFHLSDEKEEAGIFVFIYNNPDNLGTRPTDVADVFHDIFKDSPGFKEVSRETFQAQGTTGIALTIEFQESSSVFSSKTILRVYCFTSGTKVAILELSTSADLFADYVEDADQIAASFTFEPD